MDRKALRLQKSAANLQRRWQERYLADLRPDLAAFLAARPFVTEPQTGELAERFGAAYDAPPVGHYHDEFHTVTDVLRVVTALPDSDVPAWLMPSGYHETDGGAFDVPLSWGRRHAAALWSDGEGDFNLIAADGSAGVLVTVWAAEPEDSSPTGLEYNVRAWSVSSGTPANSPLQADVGR